jgi:DNA-binding NtrC family response regulator
MSNEQFGKRADVRFPMVVDAKTDPTLSDCRTRDISADGLALTASRARGDWTPQVGDEVRFEFPLPDTRDPIRARGRVVWVKADDVSVSMGAKFLEMAPRQRGALNAHLAMLRLLLGIDGVSVRSADSMVLADPRATRLMTQSRRMRELRKRLERIAPRRTPVLVEGETGTGKELVARLIHGLSGRPGDFVPVDCAALETLTESRLFGHVKGAFTGAERELPGLFEAADRGTLFLDEIQNMPDSLQRKLLRAIELGEILPVGETTARKVDIRVVAASNVPLVNLVREGHLRRDLYFRLNHEPVQLPPLRLRRQDILPLAHVFLAEFAAVEGASLRGVSVEASTALLKYPWPGNVRELRTAMERAASSAEPGDTTVGLNLLPEEIGAGRSQVLFDGRMGSETLSEATARFERELIHRALQRNAGNVSRTARELGEERMTLDRKIALHGLSDLKRRGTKGGATVEVGSTTAKAVALLVEDEEMQRKAMRKLVATRFEVLAAANAKEAMALTIDRPPDVLFIDYVLPDRDGLTLMRDLRARGCCAPAFLFTGASFGEEIEQARAEGQLAGVLVKPVAWESVLDLAVELAEP